MTLVLIEEHERPKPPSVVGIGRVERVQVDVDTGSHRRERPQERRITPAAENRLNSYRGVGVAVGSVFAVVVLVAIPVEVRSGARADFDESEGSAVGHMRAVLKRRQEDGRSADLVRPNATSSRDFADRRLVREVERAETGERRAVRGLSRVVAAGRIEVSERVIRAFATAALVVTVPFIATEQKGMDCPEEECGRLSVSSLTGDIEQRPVAGDAVCQPLVERRESAAQSAYRSNSPARPVRVLGVRG